MSTEVPNSLQQRKDLEHVYNAANNALNNANNFILNQFLSKAMGDRAFDDAVQAYAKWNIPWLPQLPKKVRQSVPEDHLGELKYPDVLLDIYTHLQRIAVGIQQSIDDEEEEDGPLLSGYKISLDNLRSLSTEVQIAIETNNLTPPANLTKDIMGNARFADNSSIVPRNWIVYKEYLNLLEYIMDVCTYFQKKLA